jgi:hypothetical protein
MRQLFPIEKADVVAAVARQKAVQHVQVAVDNRQIATRVIALQQLGRCAQQTLVELAPLVGQIVAEAVGELRELLRQVSQVPGRGCRIGPCSDGGARAGDGPITWRGAVPAPRQWLRSAPLSGATATSLRQRGVGQVLEQEVPRLGRFVAMGFETARGEAPRSD